MELDPLATLLEHVVEDEVEEPREAAVEEASYVPESDEPASEIDEWPREGKIVDEEVEEAADDGEAALPDPLPSEEQAPAWTAAPEPDAELTIADLGPGKDAAEPAPEPEADDRPSESDGPAHVEMELDSLTAHLEYLEGTHHYAALGLGPDASAGEIQRSYFQLAAVYHPDQHHEIEDGQTLEVLSDIFGVLTQAYETLRSKKRRRLYDRSIPDVTGAHETEDDDALALLFEEPAEVEPTFDEELYQQLGKHFYQIALEEFNMGDYRAANMNFKLALGMEPYRREYQVGLNKVQAILDRLKKDQDILDRQEFEKWAGSGLDIGH